MFITLISTVLTTILSWGPDALKYFQDKRDKEHELAIMQMQMQQAAQGQAARLEEINAQADIAEMYAVGARVGEAETRWVKDFNAIIRPFLAMAFFLLYASVKFIQIYTFTDTGLPWQSIAAVVWNIEDQAIFSSVIGFYFGGRLMSRMRQGK